MGAKRKAAVPFKGDAHALLVMIYQDQTLPLAIRLDAAKAAIPFETPALAAISTIDEVDTGSDAALREAVSRLYEQIRRRELTLQREPAGDSGRQNRDPETRRLRALWSRREIVPCVDRDREFRDLDVTTALLVGMGI